jgi:hypothetical protein
MDSREYRKLDIDLPRQPLSGQRGWLIAGLFLALGILIITAYEYLEHKKDTVTIEQHMDHMPDKR